MVTACRRVEHELRLPRNEAVGTWRVEAKDVASGASAAATVSVVEAETAVAAAR